MADDTFTVERSATVDAPAESIYPHIADFHRWTSWSPWEGVDPDLRRSYTGPASGIGAKYAWSGNRRAGRGSMEIVRADSPGRVEIDLIFEKPVKARNDTVFSLEPVEADPARTRVTWTMTGPQTLRGKVIGKVFKMDKLLGNDFEKGLAGLKSVAETQGASPA